MKLFFLISIAWSAVIPMDVDIDRRSSLITMTIPQAPPISVRPFLGSLNIFYGVAETFDDRQSFMFRWIRRVARFENSVAAITLQNIAFRFFNNTLSVARRRPHHWIGLGPESDLVLQHRSVDFVRDQNGSRLVLGSSAESFITNNCFDASYISTRVGGANGNVMVNGTFLNRHEAIIFSAMDNVLIISPEFFVDTFMDVLDQISRRLNGFDGPMTIEDCSVNLGAFPDISVGFPGSGNLVLAPEDYTRMSENDVCDLLVSIDEHAGTNPIQMNPLLIPSINIRITREEILICDRL